MSFVDSKHEDITQHAFDQGASLFLGENLWHD